MPDDNLSVEDIEALSRINGFIRCVCTDILGRRAMQEGDWDVDVTVSLFGHDIAMRVRYLSSLVDIDYGIAWLAKDDEGGEFFFDSQEAFVCDVGRDAMAMIITGSMTCSLSLFAERAFGHYVLAIGNAIQNALIKSKAKHDELMGDSNEE